MARQGKGRQVILANQLSDRRELRGRRPRLKRREPSQHPDELTGLGARAPPLRAGHRSQYRSQLRTRRAGIPLPTSREPGQPLVTRPFALRC
jgi:hypothetical protein